MSEHDLRLHGLEERHERAKHAEMEARSANVEVGECDACGAPNLRHQVDRKPLVPRRLAQGTITSGVEGRGRLSLLVSATTTKSKIPYNV